MLLLTCCFERELYNNIVMINYLMTISEETVHK